MLLVPGERKTGSLNNVGGIAYFKKQFYPHHKQKRKFYISKIIHLSPVLLVDCSTIHFNVNETVLPSPLLSYYTTVCPCFISNILSPSFVISVVMMLHGHLLAARTAIHFNIIIRLTINIFLFIPYITHCIWDHEV